MKKLLVCRFSYHIQKLSLFETEMLMNIFYRLQLKNYYAYFNES
jgi:hypothetical protein